MQMNSNLSNILPQMPLPNDVPIISLSGLVDLLTVLEGQLVQCPGAIPVLANTLREMLLEAIDDER
jgi:hypothetical protein